ncbi:MAG TPA: NAD(P)-dependent oxidoreductase [Clostridia bacterium]|nr:NAD(P)-dependent oxidoreductase [Clostridia bacterium]
MRGAVVMGASGFIGRALTAELSAQGIPVLAVVRPNGGEIVHSSIRRVVLDLSRLRELPQRADGEWDCFYHLAWAGTAGESRGQIDLQLRNVEYTVHAVHAAADMGCKTFVGAGSIMEKEALASSEENGKRPGAGHAYASAKLAARLMSEAAAQERKLAHIWPILTNAYGEGESSPRFLNATLRKVLRKEPLRFTKATQAYDFIHVCDVARALRLLGERGKPFCQYVVGSGQARPLRDYILEMLALVAPHAPYSFGDVPFEGIELPLSAFDTAPLRRDTGFCPEIPFEQGVRRTMAWLERTDEV